MTMHDLDTAAAVDANELPFVPPPCYLEFETPIMRIIRLIALINHQRRGATYQEIQRMAGLSHGHTHGLIGQLIDSGRVRRYTCGRTFMLYIAV